MQQIIWHRILEGRKFCLPSAVRYYS